MSTTAFTVDPHEAETVSPEEFNKHPLAREDPFARPAPDEYGFERVRYSDVDPFDELIARGAVLDGYAVEVLEVIPTGDGFAGEATVKHPETGEREIVDIADLESPPRRGTVEPKQPETTVSPPEPSVDELPETVKEWADHPVADGSAVEVPDYYEQEIAQREHILESCPVDVFCSSINRRWGHRHKLMSYYEARPGAAQSCETLIIDSGVNRWGSPEDVIEAAGEYNADYVFATDVTGLEDPSMKHHNDSMPTTDDPGIETQEDAAFEGLRRFMELAKEVGLEERVILPLQPSYMDFLDRVEAETDWLEVVDYVALGGMKTLSIHEKVRAMFEVRERLGEDMRIHALDPSTNPVVLRTLCENPHLIDSLDVSTPELALTNNKIPDATWKQSRHLFPRGKDISTIRAVSSARLTIQIAYMISPLCNDRTYREISEKLDSEATEDIEPATQSNPTETTTGGQTALSEW